MALPGELGNMTGNLADTCTTCGETLPIEVLRTNAFYLGTFCPNDGPYARKSGYFAKREEAEAALAQILAGVADPSLRDTAHH